MTKLEALALLDEFAARERSWPDMDSWPPDQDAIAGARAWLESRWDQLVPPRRLLLGRTGDVDITYNGTRASKVWLQIMDRTDGVICWFNDEKVWSEGADLRSPGELVRRMREHLGITQETTV